MIGGHSLRWKKTDKGDWLAHCREHTKLCLIYGRIYTPRKDFRHSETNNLIFNLKIKPTEKSRLNYRNQAIGRFACDVISWIQGCSFRNEHITLVPIPPSKTSGHPEYNNAVEEVGFKVANAFETVKCLPILYRTVDIESYHKDPSRRRDPEEIYKQLSINESFACNFDSASQIVILDDILTSGAHFMAARRRLIERFSNYERELIGLFWAKTQEFSPEEEPSNLQL